MNLHTKPRRDRARWLKGAPPYIAGVRDSGPKACCDRYTIFLTGALSMEPKDPLDRTTAAALNRVDEYLAMTGGGSYHWGELERGKRAGCGRHIRWLDLPQDVRGWVVKVCKEALARA